MRVDLLGSRSNSGHHFRNRIRFPHAARALLPSYLCVRSDFHGPNVPVSTFKGEDDTSVADHVHFSLGHQSGAPLFSFAAVSPPVASRHILK